MTRSTPWFRPKPTGRGFTPNNAYGWTLTGGWVATEIVNGQLLRKTFGQPFTVVAGLTLFGLYLLVVSLSGGRTIWNWFIDFKPQGGEHS